MNWRKYYQARSYAYWLSPNEYLDIVHNAWLAWYDKKKTDLFEEDFRLISRVVKLKFLASLQQNMFHYQGNRYPRQFRSVSADDSPALDAYIGSDTRLHNTVTPEVIYMDKEQNEVYDKILFKVSKELTKTQAKILKLIREDLSQVEVSGELNLTPQAINYHMKVILSRIEKVK